MRIASRHSFHIPLAALAVAITMLPASAAFSASKASQPSHSKFAGIYASESSDTSKPGPSMSASLGKDGTATITQDPGKGEFTVFGRWTEMGDQITVRFDTADGSPAPPPMVLESGHDGLRATTWDRAAWGNVTPPPMKRESSDWHAHRHLF
jgi:hypothetical protein